MYRAVGLQVVPSHLPSEHQNWKRPALADWKSLQEELVPDATFERWYASRGEHARRPNMGVLSGRASSNVFVIDLDEYKTPDALNWWQGILAEHNNRIEPETCQQVTGGGGRQLFFRAPANWHAPTNKTPIGVDIRGQGGFAVLPPSQHISGTPYAWKAGCAPWECEIAAAPDWLLQEVAELVERYGGDQNRDPVSRAKTASPADEFNAFGARTDGREDYMTKLVWAAVVNWYRECPIKPSDAESQTRMREVWTLYERKNKTRLPGENNIAGLEREGRGPTLFAEKWRRAMGKWSTDIAEASQRPLAKDEWREAMQSETVTTVSLDPVTGQPKPLLLNAADFVAGFRPPEYLIDGVIQKSYLYSLTARTGHGKTAVDMYMAQAIARGLKFHGRGVKQGAVLFLAGENPDDVRARYLVLAEHHGFDPASAPIHFVDGVIDIATCLPRIREEAAGIPDLTLVIVDTAAAYFRGDDGNNNSQQGEYARLMRQLTFLPGKPACIVNCHPVKNASKDNLLPVGGGAFLNEVDGNLTLWGNSEKQTSLHWQGKFRGPEFEPMAFEMKTIESDKVVDSNGVLMPSVVADPISENALERGERGQEDDENRILKIIAASPRASISQIAIAADFITNGKPQKSKTLRICQRLVEDKMLERHRGTKYRLTKKANKELGIHESDD